MPPRTHGKRRGGRGQPPSTPRRVVTRSQTRPGGENTAHATPDTAARDKAETGPAPKTVAKSTRKQTAIRSTGGPAPSVALRIREYDVARSDDNSTATISEGPKRVHSDSDSEVHHMRGEIDDHDHDRPIIKKPWQLNDNPVANVASSLHWIPPQASFNDALPILPLVGPPVVHQDFCALDHNGGRMFVCGSCPRANCREHFPDYINISDEDLHSLTFRCFSCYQDHKAERKHTPEAFWAFFREIDGSMVPAFKSETRLFDTFVCDNHRAVNSQVMTDPLYCLNYRLNELSFNGSPGYAMIHKLSPYWVENPDNLQLLDIPFSVSTVENAKAFRDRVDTSLQNVARLGNRARVMIFVYTHAENSSGDLFYNSDPAAGALPDWFDAMFGPGVKSLSQYHEVSIAFVCCGSIYSTPGNFVALKRLCEELGATYAFLFTEKNLMPSFTYDFFSNFAMRHYIEGALLVNQESAVAELAASSIMIAQHTNVVLLYRKVPKLSALTAYEVVWLSKHRPAGMNVPIQCKKCGAVHPFKIVESYDHKSWIATCSRCQYALPPYTLESGMKAVNASVIGRWHLIARG